ncbi:MAG: Crp/Fnr family transcriptional regulator [Candidatus Binatus sp.]|uniref:Crp/Fnr family transcriptional regulator n=1 Tax=Candidatus Binatus sp. TaxID=2811406 RepID=UPI003BB0D7C1
MTATIPKTRPSDLQLLGRLKGLAWLSSAQLKNLVDSMTTRNVKHKDVIFEERGARSEDTYIMLSGTAELRRVDGTRSRVVAIMSPGVLFRMPMMAPGVEHTFRWIALSDCRVAQLTTNSFISIGLGVRPADFLKLADWENERRGYLMGRYPSFLGLRLQGRVAVALLELSGEFGVQETRGILIRVALTERQLADLVGASRAKVGQVLRDFQRMKVVIREGHLLAVVTRRLEAMVRANRRIAA